MVKRRLLISSRCRVVEILLDHQGVLVVGVGEKLLGVVALTRHEDGVFADRVILVLFGDLFPEDELGLFELLFLHQVFGPMVGGHGLGRIDEVDPFLFLFVGFGPIERLHEPFHRSLNVVGIGHLRDGRLVVGLQGRGVDPRFTPGQDGAKNGQARQRASSRGGPSSAPTPNRKAIRHP